MDTCMIHLALDVLDLSHEVSEDEMWKVIEGYGIQREMMEMSNPSPKALQAIYQAIKKRNSQT